MKNQTLIFALIIFILALGAWYYFGRDSVEAPTDTEVDTTAGLRVGENAIFVADQKPGDSVVVSLAETKEGGYVVIHESVNGTPGTIIGHSTLLPAGESNTITVPLDRTSKNGEELIAMLHNDNGNGVYTEADDPTRDSSGNPVHMRFQIADDASDVDASTSIQL